MVSNSLEVSVVIANNVVVFVVAAADKVVVVEMDFVSMDKSLIYSRPA